MHSALRNDFGIRYAAFNEKRTKWLRLNDFIPGVHRLEQLRLLQVEAMPGVRHDGQPGSRDRALEQQARLQAGLVLVAVDHQRGRADAGQLAGDVVQGRPGSLDPLGCQSIGFLPSFLRCLKLGARVDVT